MWMMMLCPSIALGMCGLWVHVAVFNDLPTCQAAVVETLKVQPKPPAMLFCSNLPGFLSAAKPVSTKP